jgi:hypothetical protein
MSNKSTGNLYVNEYKKAGEKKPDFTGFLDLTREQVIDLVNDGKAGKEVKLKLGCWKYPSKRNPQQVRLFLVAETGEPEKKQSNDSWGSQTADSSNSGNTEPPDDWGDIPF